MAREDNKIIPMIFDETFTVKWLYKNGNNKIIIKQQITIAKVLELSPEDYDIQLHYAQCLTKINLGRKAEQIFYENIVNDFHVADSFYELSQLNIELNEPNKAFLFGINYVLLTDDQDFREVLEKTFEVTYTSEHKIELEAQLFTHYYSNSHTTTE